MQRRYWMTDSVWSHESQSDLIAGVGMVLSCKVAITCLNYFLIREGCNEKNICPYFISLFYTGENNNWIYKVKLLKYWHHLIFSHRHKWKSIKQNRTKINFIQSLLNAWHQVNWSCNQLFQPCYYTLTARPKLSSANFKRKCPTVFTNISQHSPERREV
jgi:hypothetical protein